MRSPRSIHRKEEKRVTGSLQIIARAFFSFSSSSLPTLIFVLEERKNEKRGEMEDNSLEFHRDQHFSIRRIIHFFSPLSIGRSLSPPLFFFSYPSRLDVFFCFFFFACNLQDTIVCWWAGFRSIDQFEDGEMVVASVRRNR